MKTYIGIAFAVLLVIGFIGGINAVNARVLPEQQIRLSLYVYPWSEDHDIGKIRITASYQGKVLSDSINYEMSVKQHYNGKDYAKVHFVFPPLPQGLIGNKIDMCLTNSKTEETYCTWGWFFPGQEYVRQIIEIPNHEY